RNASLSQPNTKRMQRPRATPFWITPGREPVCEGKFRLNGIHKSNGLELSRVYFQIRTNSSRRFAVSEDIRFQEFSSAECDAHHIFWIVDYTRFHGAGHVVVRSDPETSSRRQCGKGQTQFPIAIEVLGLRSSHR